MTVIGKTFCLSGDGYVYYLGHGAEITSMCTHPNSLPCVNKQARFVDQGLFPWKPREGLCFMTQDHVKNH